VSTDSQQGVAPEAMPVRAKSTPIDWATRLALGLASAAIVAAARGDLWLDEIWSLMFAMNAESALDIVTSFRHDNNHPLNTLFLYCAGTQEALVVYRLHAILAGVGSLLLCAHVARRDWGRMEALVSTALVGMSFPLLLYLSEARGYALAIAFGLGAYAALGPDPATVTRWRTALFWVCSALGMVSHASFVMLSVGFALWSAVRIGAATGSLGRTLRRLAVLHGPPFVVIVGWYGLFLRDMTIGGGPEYSTGFVTGQAAVMLLGLPDSPGGRAVAPVLLLLLIGLGSWWLRRQGDARWSLFPAVLVVAPALVLLAARPERLYFRYVVVCFPFALLLLARLAVGGCRAPQRHWRWLALAGLAGVLAGQVPRNGRLMRFGRGQYAEALRFIAAQPDGRTVLIGSDHDFRNRVLVDFYAARLDRGASLRYVGQEEWAEKTPEWILLHSQDLSWRPPEVAVLKDVATYRRVREYGFCGVSGWRWILLERVEPEPRAADPSGGG